MWKCLNCGATFENPGKTCETPDTGWGHEDYCNVCPECHIDDIEELHLCRCEREYITDEQDRCWQCEKEIDEAMKEARERIMSGNRRDFQSATDDMVQWVEREA
jgi:hypothetical protein